jgi:hypothetical protein
MLNESICIDALPTGGTEEIAASCSHANLPGVSSSGQRSDKRKVKLWKRKITEVCWIRPSPTSKSSWKIYLPDHDTASVEEKRTKQNSPKSFPETTGGKILLLFVPTNLVMNHAYEEIGLSWFSSAPPIFGVGHVETKGCGHGPSERVFDSMSRGCRQVSKEQDTIFYTWSISQPCTIYALEMVESIFKTSLRGS